MKASVTPQFIFSVLLMFVGIVLMAYSGTRIQVLGDDRWAVAVFAVAICTVSASYTGFAATFAAARIADLRAEIASLKRASGSDGHPPPAP